MEANFQRLYLWSTMTQNAKELLHLRSDNPLAAFSSDQSVVAVTQRVERLAHMEKLTFPEGYIERKVRELYHS